MSEQETDRELVKCRECGALLRDADAGLGCPGCLLGIGLRENPGHDSDDQHFAERYRIGSFMGRGGMGQVFTAVDSQLGRQVAIKLLVGERYKDREKVKRFRQEALTLSKVNHPNVCTIHDVGVSAEGPYFVMELVHGQTIGELVKGGAIPVKQALDLMIQACRGIHAIHAKGIVHRDIKPSNVMVTTGNLLKIVDFGLATRVSKRGDDRTAFNTVDSTLTDEVQTLAGHIVGTPNYMSPEQASGQFVDARTDVFSLGAVFYVMLTGAPPFQAETPMLTMHAVISRKYQPIRDRNPDVPEAIADLVEKMLADIEERFEDFAAVIEALEMHVANATTSVANTGVMVSGLKSEVSAPDFRNLRQTGFQTRTVLLCVILFCIPMLCGVVYWASSVAGITEIEDPVAPVPILEARDGKVVNKVAAVVIDPAIYNDQKSPESATSRAEDGFYELMKATLSRVLVDHAIPVRVFDEANWSRVASVSRFDDGSLDFHRAVRTVLGENQANLFLTISGYYDQSRNTYQYGISFLNTEGTGFHSTHMEFADEVVQGQDAKVVRERFELWFDENFARSASDD